MFTAHDLLQICRDPQSDCDQMFEMASLFRDRTGLPFKVWVSDNTYAKSHNEPRLKVEVEPGNLTSVRLDPPYEEVGTPLKAADKKLLVAWIELNRETIMAYWNQEIDTGDMTSRMKKLPE